MIWGFELLVLANGTWGTTPERPNHQSNHPPRHLGLSFVEGTPFRGAAKLEADWKPFWGTYSNFGACCLDVRTLAFCQLMGFPY